MSADKPAAPTLVDESDNFTNTSIAEGPTQLMSSTVLTSVSLYFFLIAPIAVFGVFTNIANMVVFWRMGFSASSSACYFSLSVCDCFCAVYLVIAAWGRHPVLGSYDYVIIRSTGLVYTLVPFFYSCTAFGSWVTVIIIMERCCYVVFPTKVQTVFTRTTVNILLVMMLVCQVATTTIHYVYICHKAIISPTTNNTVVIMDLSDYNNRAAVFATILSFSILITFCYVVITLGTIFLVARLNQSSEWHNSVSRTKEQVDLTARENHESRAVILVCVLYIVCLFPSVVIFWLSAFGPSFNMISPVMGNVVRIFSAFAHVFQAVSCSVKIFIYLAMNAMFRTTFANVFFCR